jgi:uncharacterized FlaG/YvyC family protein
MVEEGESIGSMGRVDPSPTYDNLPVLPASPAASASQQPTPQPTAQEIQDAVARVNDRLSSVNRVLTLNVDAGSGLTVATIRDSQTGEVLEQYPSTDSVHLAQMLAGWASGKNILVDLIA